MAGQVVRRQQTAEDCDVSSSTVHSRTSDSDLEGVLPAADVERQLVGDPRPRPRVLVRQTHDEQRVERVDDRIAHAARRQVGAAMSDRVCEFSAAEKRQTHDTRQSPRRHARRHARRAARVRPS